VSAETIVPIAVKKDTSAPSCFEWFSRHGNRKYWVLHEGSGGCMTDDKLVEGDIVFLSAGQVCPADSRILVQTIDAVMCKGEKRWYPTTTPTSETAIESRNMIFVDTAVEAGAVFVFMLRTPPKRTYIEAFKATFAR
jgi:magnesium-transporting ATPase (P-type)